MPNKTETISSTTQNFLDVFDITNNFLIMKNGTVTAILTVNAMNFGLLAEEEQDAIIYAYAALLNSLNYPVQIIIQTQTKDVTSYLSLLKTQEDKAVSPGKRRMIARYRNFVTDLIKERNVLDKNFYIAIPANSLELGLLAPTSVVPGTNKFNIATVDKAMLIEKARNLLEPKIEHLMSQFNRLGLIAKQLTTQEIIKVFYTNYNPEASEGQQITNSNAYTTPLVQASVIGDIMTDKTQTAPVTNQAAAATQPSAQTTPVGQTPIPTPTPAQPAPMEQPDPSPTLAKNTNIQESVPSIQTPKTKPEPSTPAPTQTMSPPTQAPVSIPKQEVKKDTPVMIQAAPQTEMQTPMVKTEQPAQQNTMEQNKSATPGQPISPQASQSNPNALPPLPEI